MENVWVCGECLKNKHHDCEAFRESTGDFCDCGYCIHVFKRNVRQSLREASTPKSMPPEGK